MSFAHCKDRLNKRYGMDMDLTQYLYLLYDICARHADIDNKNHNNGLVMVLGDKRTLWKAKLLETNTYVYCVFDPKTQSLVTILSKKQAEDTRRKFVCKVKKRRPRYTQEIDDYHLMAGECYG